MNSIAEVADRRVASVLAELDQLVYPSLDRQPLDLSDLHRRLFDLGQVQAISHNHSTVAHIVQWAARRIAANTPRLEGVQVTVCDRDDDRARRIDGFLRGLPLSLTAQRGSRYVGQDIVAARNADYAADLHLPRLNIDSPQAGCFDEWELMLSDLAAILDRIEL